MLSFFGTKFGIFLVPSYQVWYFFGAKFGIFFSCVLGFEFRGCAFAGWCVLVFKFVFLCSNLCHVLRLSRFNFIFPLVFISVLVATVLEDPKLNALFFFF